MIGDWDLALGLRMGLGIGIMNGIGDFGLGIEEALGNGDLK